jgi:hypothetical protein
LGAEDVVLLAGELESMEGLTELDLRHTALGKEGCGGSGIGWVRVAGEAHDQRGGRRGDGLDQESMLWIEL